MLLTCFLVLSPLLVLGSSADSDSRDTTSLGVEELSSPLELDALEGLLTRILEETPWDDPRTPLLYVEDGPSPVVAEKRSRYYRRYPWKRQNNGRQYDYDSYMCSPSKQDVFHLLVALHEARGGNLDRTINFCNRKRPAKAVFTNIRFLGRRK